MGRMFAAEGTEYMTNQNRELGTSIVDTQVRRMTLTQTARDDIRAQARTRALRTMTEAEWEKRRAESGDPVKADVEMAFGPETE